MACRLQVASQVKFQPESCGGLQDASNLENMSSSARQHEHLLKRAAICPSHGTIVLQQSKLKQLGAAQDVLTSGYGIPAQCHGRTIVETPVTDGNCLNASLLAGLHQL